MDEYIERENAIAWFMPYAHAGESIDADVVIADIKGMKAADVAPLQHGRWIYDHWCEFKCSLCGEFSNSNPYRGKENYCPNCGAIMDGKCKESAGEE